MSAPAADRVYFPQRRRAVLTAPPADAPCMADVVKAICSDFLSNDAKAVGTSLWLKTAHRRPVLVATAINRSDAKAPGYFCYKPPTATRVLAALHTGGSQ